MKPRTVVTDEALEAIFEDLKDGGNVAKALERWAITRSQFYLALQRNPDLRVRFDDAMQTYADMIRAEVDHRARHGALETEEVFGVDGELVKRTERLRRSDSLLMKLAEAHCPEFRPKVEVKTTEEPVPELDMNKLSQDERDQLRALAEKLESEEKD